MHGVKCKQRAGREGVEIPPVDVEEFGAAQQRQRHSLRVKLHKIPQTGFSSGS